MISVTMFGASFVFARMVLAEKDFREEGLGECFFPMKL
jgi:hypothetical protein